MDKTTFRKFARLVGNEEDLLPVEPDDVGDEPIINEDETGEEPAVEADAQTKPEKTEQKLTKPMSKPVEVPTELAQLNSLVTELGGVEALKTMLLAAATVTANSMQQEANERTSLTQAIVSNSAGQFEEADLKDVPLPALRKMAASYAPMRQIDYGALGAVQINAKKGDVALRPGFFTVAKAN